MWNRVYKRAGVYLATLSVNHDHGCVVENLVSGGKCIENGVGDSMTVDQGLLKCHDKGWTQNPGNNCLGRKADHKVELSPASC